MYPKIIINIQKLRENIIALQKMCRENGIEPYFVTKVIASDPEVLEKLTDLNIAGFADSRTENLKKLKDFKEKKLLLRIPMLSELEELVDYVDYVLISEKKTLIELNEICRRKNKKIGIILMTDLGDLREGDFYEEEFYSNAKLASELSYLKFSGIGANLTCYGAILPSVENLTLLVKRARHIEETLGVKLEIVSGLGSNGLYLLKQGKIPGGITQFRIGEATFIGTEASYGLPLSELNQDIAVLEVEIVELKRKPSLPIGEAGRDAFGGKPVFEDLGERKRAIVAIGKQDTEIDSLEPMIEGAKIMGASSDHLIVDVEDCEEKLSVGDKISFKVGYTALLRAFTSTYVKKEIR